LIEYGAQLGTTLIGGGFEPGQALVDVPVSISAHE
jgi:hypothetical protein